MADSVQAILDSMVPPLRDLLDRGIITQPELRSVVDRRRRYEYLLARRHARKSDFLRYVEDETKLERLRKLRNGRKRRKMAEEDREERERRRERGLPAETEDEEREREAERERRWRPSIGDGHIAKHVHFIFTRALRKWREDAELHRAHADFARSVGSWGRLGRIFAEALQVHPKDESLWIEASSHEFFGPPSLQSDPTYDPDDPTDPRNAAGAANLGGSVRSARVLLQRGLRANPTSRELWWQHFCLELHYVQKLRGRREILRLGLKGSEDGAGSDGKDFFMEEGDDDDDAEGGSAVSDAVPLVVYRNAIKAVPDDAAFRLKFVDLSRTFPETDRLRKAVVRTIERDFGASVEAWIARAQYAAEGLLAPAAVEDGWEESPGGFLALAREQTSADGHSEDSGSEENPVHAVLYEAVRRVPTSEMYLGAIQLVSDRLRSRGREEGDSVGVEDDDDDDGLVHGSNAGVADAAFLGRLLDRASSAGVLAGSADLILARADFLLATGNARGAADSLRSACLGSANVSSKSGGGSEKESGDKGSACEDARVWLRWADLLGLLDSSSSRPGAHRETPEDALRLALDRVPVRNPGHGHIAAALFRRLLLAPPAALRCSGSQKGGGSAKKRRQLAADRRAKAVSLLGRILVLSDKSSDAAAAAIDGDSTAALALPIDAAELCMALLRAASLSGGVSAARAAYDPVLFRSGYAGSCGGMSEREIRSMAAFFEACLRVEKSAAVDASLGSRSAVSDSAKETIASRRRIGRIYDAAIAFFREGGNVEGANHFRHRKGVDQALLS